MSRRSTLGPLSLSSAHLNSSAVAVSSSRKSLSSAALTSHDSRSITDRNSLSRTSLSNPSSRRSSAANKQSSAASQTRADPRPIGDKSFLRENIKRLIMYLSAHNYGRMLSPKVLMAPSGKEFRLIVEFLFTQFDPEFKFSCAVPFEDEVKKYMKMFGYPIAVSKQSLAAPGIPHIWPALLAMLIWLIEFLQYNEKLSAAASTSSSVSGSATKFLELENNEKLFFDYSAAAYGKFLSGADSTDELDSELRKSFDLKNNAILSELQALRNDKKRIQAELESQKRSIEEFQALKSSKANLTEDKTKFVKVIEELNKHRETIEKKIDEKNATQTEQREAIKAAAAEREKLAAIVAAQEFTPIQVQSMMNQRVLLEESVSSLSKQKDKIHCELNNFNSISNKKTAEIRLAVQKFNEIANEIGFELNQIEIQQNIQLQIIDENESQNQQTTENSRNSSGSSEFVSFSISPGFPSVRENFQSLDNAIAEKLSSAMKELRAAADEIASLEEAKLDRNEKILALEGRIKKIDETYKSEKEFMQKELTAAVSRVEDEELHIHKLKSGSTMEFDNSIKQLDRLDEEIRLQKAQQEMEKRQFADSFTAAMESLLSHKERLEHRIGSILQQATNTKVAMENI